MGDFYALVGTDTDMWKGVIGKHGVTGVNENGRYLLMLCWKQRTPHHEYLFPARRSSQVYTWYRPSMDRISLLDFCIIQSDLFSNV